MVSYPAFELGTSRGRLEFLMISDSELWARALNVIPSGTQTFSKAPYQHVEGVAPKYLARGAGSKVWDLEGRSYLDHILGLGPVILGHADVELTDYLCEVMKSTGVCLSLPHEAEITLAEKLVSLIPSAEKVRFAKNGSDATSGAVRAARAYTGRSMVACSGYHGWHDWYIGSTSRNLGVPTQVSALTKSFVMNDYRSFNAVIEETSADLAAIIMEPLGVESLEPEFLAYVRDYCDDKGVVLIFDEVISGFRFDLGGAQTDFAIKPDLSCFGKAMGNGHPVSALVGKAEIMDSLDKAFFSFTFGGEIVGLFAAIKTIQLLEQRKTLETIHDLGFEFIRRVSSQINDIELGDYIGIKGKPFWPVFKFSGSQNFQGAHVETFFRQELVKRSVLTRPGVFFSGAHSQADLDDLCNAVYESLQLVKDGIDSENLLAKIEGKVVTPVIRG